MGPIDAEVIRAIMKSIDLVLPDVTNRVEFISGIISEIQEPAEEVQMPVTVAAQESNETKMRVFFNMENFLKIKCNLF